MGDLLKYNNTCKGKMQLRAVGMCFEFEYKMHTFGEHWLGGWMDCQINVLECWMKGASHNDANAKCSAAQSRSVAAHKLSSVLFCSVGSNVWWGSCEFVIVNLIYCTTRIIPLTDGFPPTLSLTHSLLSCLPHIAYILVWSISIVNSLNWLMLQFEWHADG